MLLGNSDPENVVISGNSTLYPKNQNRFLSNRRVFRGNVRLPKRSDSAWFQAVLSTRNGREIPIERFYHRFIFDELVQRKDIQPGLSFEEDLDVEWVGHPNWFFKISKYSLPLITGRYSPSCFYLHQLESYPDDLENYVLKPLFSFAGSGVKIDLTKDILDDITDPENYILQRKVSYHPFLKTLDIPAKAEIRLMFLWDKEPILVNNLLRMSKGKMMGVDYNLNKTWVGSSICYHRSGL